MSDITETMENLRLLRLTCNPDPEIEELWNKIWEHIKANQMESAMLLQEKLFTIIKVNHVKP